jgi:DNA-binding NtrC family response regulator
VAHLLLIDDEPDLIAGQLRHAFPPPTHRVEVARTGVEGLDRVRADPPDMVLLDLHLPDQHGLEVFEAIRAADARIPMVFITLSKTADTAIEAMKRGAFDYLFKPPELARLQRVVGEALEVARRMREPAVLAETLPAEDVPGAIVGSCAAMLEVYKSIGRVAAQDVPVLITGESGTGKELVARAIYQHSRRGRSPFFALNCAAIPENLLESELFGHEKGAFTGADRRRIGRFEQCNGGTLFLDEIGDMPLSLQAKMLRILQEQTFERVGGSETIHVNVRIISATHRDLGALSLQGQFRADLFYRLGVFMIHLPSLRERLEDLPMLIRHFLRRFNRDLGRDVRDVSPEAMDRLREYHWPGNIRELQSVLKQAMLQARGTTLLPAFLPPVSGERAPIAGSPASEPLTLEAFLCECLTSADGDVYAEAHRRLDRLLLPRLLEEAEGNQQQAARRMGISRETLRRRLRELGLHLTRRAEIEETDRP